MASPPPTPSSSSSLPEPPSIFSELPVTAMRGKIVEKILENRVTVIVGETGSGKWFSLLSYLLPLLPADAPCLVIFWSSFWMWLSSVMAVVVDFSLLFLDGWFKLSLFIVWRFHLKAVMVFILSLWTDFEPCDSHECCGYDFWLVLLILLCAVCWVISVFEPFHDVLRQHHDLFWTGLSLQFQSPYHSCLFQLHLCLLLFLTLLFSYAILISDLSFTLARYRSYLHESVPLTLKHRRQLAFLKWNVVGQKCINTYAITI